MKKILLLIIMFTVLLVGCKKPTEAVTVNEATQKTLQTTEEGFVAESPTASQVD